MKLINKLFQTKFNLIDSYMFIGVGFSIANASLIGAVLCIVVSLFIQIVHHWFEMKQLDKVIVESKSRLENRK